ARRARKRRADRARDRDRARGHRAADGRSRSLQGDRSRAAPGEDRYRHQGTVAMTQDSTGRAWFRGGRSADDRAQAAQREHAEAVEAILTDLRQLGGKAAQAEKALPRFRESVAAAGFDR